MKFIQWINVRGRARTHIVDIKITCWEFLSLTEVVECLRWESCCERKDGTVHEYPLSEKLPYDWCVQPSGKRTIKGQPWHAACMEHIHSMLLSAASINYSEKWGINWFSLSSLILLFEIHGISRKRSTKRSGGGNVIPTEEIKGGLCKTAPGSWV